MRDSPAAIQSEQTDPVQNVLGCQIVNDYVIYVCEPNSAIGHNTWTCVANLRRLATLIPKFLKP